MMRREFIVTAAVATAGMCHSVEVLAKKSATRPAGNGEERRQHMIKHMALMNFTDTAAAGDPIAQYEGEHVPLVQSLLPFFTEYRRSYVIPDARITRGHDEGSPQPSHFDVMTELWYDAPEKLAQLAHALSVGDTTHAIAESDSRLFDQSRTSIFDCEEYITPGESLQPRPAGHDGPPAIKLIGTIRKRADMTRAAFIDRYENGHCALALSVLTKDGMPTFAGYRRSFPLPEARFPIAQIPTTPAPFDVMTQVWFWTEADLQYFMKQRADEKVDAALSHDEAQLFDRKSIIMHFVKEYV